MNVGLLVVMGSLKLTGGGAAVLFGAIAVMLGVPMIWWMLIRPFWLRYKTGEWPGFEMGDPL